jgi:PhnB protein
MLYVPNVRGAIDFYQDAFGFVNIFQLPNALGEIDFARMRYRGSNFTLSTERNFDFDGLSPATSNHTPPFLFYLCVDDVDQILVRAANCGCQVLQSSRLEFWGDRKARIKDPFGYIWEIATKVSSDE